jgi:alkanesulfonate monooxygenase SsuD/methylene tetrahydromethanopterin reductase-like flavin-dependent oxidoreductase (luciferase family)
VAEMALAAENAGWDGIFVWEPVWGIDPWVSLAAAAMVTERIRLGTMLTPLSRRRPWKLASETATLDRLSNGRVILAVGLGAVETGFAEFGEETDRRLRAELLDEGLAILDGLWRGQPFSFTGKHYAVREVDHLPPPPPVQRPRIPVWVVGAWPRPRSMARAAHWDGLLPMKLPVGTSVLSADDARAALMPEDIRTMKTWIEAHREADTPYDIVVEGETPGDDPTAAAAQLSPWAEAGATWWLEAMWGAMSEPERVWERIRQGPPSGKQ